ncbi:hypothetical protein F4818DRAFT_329398 [Hypoxylon cercidicola]|nr:hypothetical protein F4818DRAFT_329398 [Hypoxylon cercidicola]
MGSTVLPGPRPRARNGHKVDTLRWWWWWWPACLAYVISSSSAGLGCISGFGLRVGPILTTTTTLFVYSVLTAYPF